MGSYNFAKKKRIKSAQKELEQAISGTLDDQSVKREKELAAEIEWLLEQEEIHYAQSRVDWLKFGDRNTVYFKNFASTRRKRNMIKKLRGDNGVRLEGSTALNPHISHYFEGLFASDMNGTDPGLLNKVTP